MSTPTTVNKTLQTTETLINDGVMKVLSPLVIQVVSSIPQLSFLKIWPISSIFASIVNFILRQFSTLCQDVGVRLVITAQTNEERSAYSQAEGVLRAALLTGDPNAISKARAQANAAIDALIHYDGSASPVS